MKVVKKDQSLEDFNPQKISVAVNKAAMRCDKTVDEASHQRTRSGDRGRTS